MKMPKILKNNSELSRKIRGKRFDIITIILIIIAVTLSIIATCYTAFKMYEIKNGKDVGDIYNYIKKEDDIFNIKNYVANIEATIVSNKNVNTYIINQYYSNKENIVKEKTEFKDSQGNSINLTYDGTSLQVKSDSQKLTYLLEKYDLNNFNYLDLDSIIKKYINIKEGKLNGKIENLEKDNNIIIKIEYDKGEHLYNGRLVRTEIYINKGNNKIQTMTHYDKDNKAICSIKYNEIEINKKIDDSIFDF